MRTCERHLLHYFEFNRIKNTLLHTGAGILAYKTLDFSFLYTTFKEVYKKIDKWCIKWYNEFQSSV